MDMQRHEGATVVVTGAGNGIGRATVMRMAAEGARVIGCDNNADALSQTQTLLADSGLSASLLSADVTHPADIERIVALAGPRIHILANVAGIMDHFVPVGDLDDATWFHVLDVNLTGVMRLSRAVLPLMQSHGGGSIVTVASVASLHAGCAGVSYVASKHAVIGLVRHIAYFYGPENIRSNAVCPGAVNTAIGTTSTPRVAWAMERAAANLGAIPPAAEPDEIATLISWLGSSEASNVNGAVITADGGWDAA